MCTSSLMLHSHEQLPSRQLPSKQKADLCLHTMCCRYSEPTPIQRQAVPTLLQDRELLAVAPTGVYICARLHLCVCLSVCA